MTMDTHNPIINSPVGAHHNACETCAHVNNAVGERPCRDCFTKADRSMSEWEPVAAPVKKPAGALARQEGGGHYKDMAIQPIEFIHANNIPFAEGCAIKYLTRWRSKGGVEDLKKARHFIDLLIELETRE